MDYTVGSVADLISGKNTPNKPKVKKRKLQHQTPIDDIDNQQSVAVAPNKKSKKLRTKKKKQKISPSSGDSNMVVIDHDMFSVDSEIKLEPSDIKTENVDNDNAISNTTGAVPMTKHQKKKARKLQNKDKQEHKPEIKDAQLKQDERNSRTVFVGNVPVTIKKRQLMRLFAKYGHVDSVRLRCVAPAEPGIPKKVAYIKKLLHPKRLTAHSYVTFALREDATKALAENGMKYKDHHLRVQIANDSERPDARKAIFIGNLPFDIEDEELWKVFESCGPIVSVRIVRDTSTNMGIGIAYVNFESADSVELALQMQNVTIKNKVVRIQRYSQKQKHGQRNWGNKSNSRASKLKETFKRPKNYPSGFQESGEAKAKTTNITVKNCMFQGSKSNLKKKKPKANKGVLNKMKLSNKIAPRKIE